MSEPFNPWSLPRPEIREDEREYADPRHPGVLIRLRFRELNPFSEGQALRLYGEYYEKFIKPKASGNGKSPSSQLLPTPVPVLLNELTLDDLVLLQAMHVPPGGQQKYGLMEWTGFAVNMPDAYREMVRVCKELNRGLEQDPGNQESPETTSGDELSSRLYSTDSPIPTGCSTSPEPSDPAPEASEHSVNGLESARPISERTQDNSTTASLVTTSG